MHFVFTALASKKLCGTKRMRLRHSSSSRIVSSDGGGSSSCNGGGGCVGCSVSCSSTTKQIKIPLLKMRPLSKNIGQRVHEEQNVWPQTTEMKLELS